MKLFELMKLGHKNITAHKKRNFMTAVVISALFGLILGIHFLLQGLEDALQHEASRFTDGKTYVATYAEKACGGEKEKIKIEIGDNIIWTDALCKDGDAMIPIVEERVKKYGGSVIGKETSYTHGGVYKVAVPYDLIKNFGEINMSLKQPGTIPIVTSSTNAQELNNIRIGKKSADEQKLNQTAKLREKTLGKVYSPENDPTSQFSIVGLYPSGIASLELAKLPGDLKILDIVLGQVRFPYASNFIIDDGSKSVKKYLGDNVGVERVISVFSSSDDAHNYYRNEDCLATERKCEDYLVSGAFSNQIDVEESFWLVRKMLGLVEPVLVIIAIIIVVFTFIRLVDQDARLVALYRSLGATKLDVFTIYLWYLVELCLLSILLASVIGLVMACIISLLNMSTLRIELEAFYGLKPQIPLVLVGINAQIAKLMATIMIIAPATSILTIDQLSSRNIAKRLKNE